MNGRLAGSLVLSALLLACTSPHSPLDGNNSKPNTSLGRLNSIGSTDPASLYVWHYPNSPQVTDPYANNLYARHMGTQFKSHKPRINDSEVLNLTGTQLPISGASRAVSGNSTPSFITMSRDEVGYYVDTNELNELGYFPFPVDYCRAVGLGAPQATLERNLANLDVRPWVSDTTKLTLSVDLQVPYSDLRVRTRLGQYVEKSDMDLNDHGPVFISSSFLYLRDTRSGRLIAVLFNYYDPRPLGGFSVGNDNMVYFFSGPMNSFDGNGRSLSEFFTVESGSYQNTPFRGYKTFRLSISRTQMAAMIRSFGTSLALSSDPADYKVEFAGLLNEMNFHYKAPASECVPDYDPNTYAKVGMSYRNFDLALNDNTPPVQPSELRGYLDGVFVLAHNDIRIIGWGCEKSQANPVRATLHIDGQFVAAVDANEDSEPGVDVACDEFSAPHRFSFRLTPRQLRDWTGKPISVTLHSHDGLRLKDLPIYPGQKGTLPNFLGAQDGVTDEGLIRGWACAQTYDQKVDVTLYAGAQRLGVVTANLDGEDAVGTVCSSGRVHRFEYQLSPMERSIFSGRTVDAKIESAGESVFTLVTFPGINYSIR